MAIRRSLDVGRLGKAVERPGIDPRVWVATGTIEEIGFDAEHGVFADVKLQPEGNVETCYIGTNCAGSVDGKIGWGDSNPLEVDDTVVVVNPGGDGATGPVIIARLWNSGDRPPVQIQDGEDVSKDRWIIVKPGQNLEILASLKGEIDTGGTQVTTTPSQWKALSQVAGGALKTEASFAAAGASIKCTGPLPVAIDTDMPLGIELGGPAAMPLAHAVETLLQGAAGSVGILAVQTALTTAVAALSAIGAAPLTGASAAAAFAPALATLSTAMATMTASMGAAAATLPTMKVRGA